MLGGLLQSLLFSARAESPPKAPLWQPIWSLPLQVREQPWGQGDHFYVVAGPPGQPARLMALDPATGKMVWTTPFDVKATVAVDQQHIAVRDAAGTLQVVDRLTGRPAPSWPAGAPPFLFDAQRRYLHQRQGVTAVGEQNQELWHTALGWVEISSGEIADGIMVLRGRPAPTGQPRPDRRAIAALDINTGKLLWQTTHQPHLELSPVWVRQGRAWYLQQGPSQIRQITRTVGGTTTTSTTPAGVDEHRLIGRNLRDGAVQTSLAVTGSVLDFGRILGWDGDDLAIQVYAAVADNQRQAEIQVIDTAQGKLRRRFFIKDFQPNQSLATGSDGWVMNWRRRLQLLNTGGDYIPTSGVCRVDRNTGALLGCSRPFERMTLSAPELVKGVALIAIHPFSFSGKTYGGPPALQGYALR